MIVAEEISVDIPFSKAVRTVEVHPEGGSALFDEALKVSLYVVSCRFYGNDE